MQQTKVQKTIKHIRTEMENGSTDWRMPWHGKNPIPINIISVKPYTGLNHLILLMSRNENGYESRYWGTFNQWRTRRSPVLKGEKATTVFRPVYSQKGGSSALAYFKPFWLFSGDQVTNRNEQHPDFFEIPFEVPNVDKFVRALELDP